MGHLGAAGFGVELVVLEEIIWLALGIKRRVHIGRILEFGATGILRGTLPGPALILGVSISADTVEVAGNHKRGVAGNGGSLAEPAVNLHAAYGYIFTILAEAIIRRFEISSTSFRARG